MLSSLAPGIDTIVAEAALDYAEDRHANVTVRAPLPFPVETYRRASTFQTTNQRRRYDHLVGRIRRQHGDLPQHQIDRNAARDLFSVGLHPSIDGAPEKDLEAAKGGMKRRHIRYRAAGEFVAAYSDLLLAWYDERIDGLPAKGRPFGLTDCGTSAIVQTKLDGMTHDLLPVQNTYDWADSGPVLHIPIDREKKPETDSLEEQLPGQRPLAFYYPFDCRPPDCHAECPFDDAAWQEAGNSLLRTVAGKLVGLQRRAREASDPRRENGALAAMLGDAHEIALRKDTPFDFDALARTRRNVADANRAEDDAVKSGSVLLLASRSPCCSWRRFRDLPNKDQLALLSGVQTGWLAEQRDFFSKKHAEFDGRFRSLRMVGSSLLYAALFLVVARLVVFTLGRDDLFAGASSSALAIVGIGVLGTLAVIHATIAHEHPDPSRGTHLWRWLFPPCGAPGGQAAAIWKRVNPALVGRLRLAGLEVYHYLDDKRLAYRDEPERESFVTDIYDYLRDAKVLVVIASDDYFETPDLGKKKNLYCPIELAEAVSHDSRPLDRFFWVFPQGGNITNSNSEPQLKPLFESFHTNVLKERGPTPTWTAHGTQIPDPRSTSGRRRRSSRPTPMPSSAFSMVPEEPPNNRSRWLTTIRIPSMNWCGKSVIALESSRLEDVRNLLAGDCDLPYLQEWASKLDLTDTLTRVLA